MYITIKRLLLAASVVCLCVGTAFPAFADGPGKTSAGEVVPGAVPGEAPSGTSEKASGTTDNAASNLSDQAEKAPSQDEDGYVDAGPGAKKKEVIKEVPQPKETSLGMFTITGYCGCSKCSGSHSLTYSGTVPTANHTISADLNLFPLGTKLKIDGIVYTVEDKGSAVKGKTLDIYYDTHEEALAKGRYTAEVFLVNN